MNNKLHAFAGLAMVIIGAALTVSCNRIEHSAGNADEVPERATDSSRPSGRYMPRSKSDEPTVERATDPKVSAYLCSPADSDCRVQGNPFAASSPSEAAWLMAHGYPTKERYDRLARMSLEQLHSEAASGDRSAAVFYAQKVALIPEGFYDGMGMLHDEAVAGNLFAYYGLSEVYRNSTEHKDLVASAAYLRVAYLLGDWKSTNRIGQLGLSSVELAVADERAASLKITFSGNVEPSPRPLE